MKGEAINLDNRNLIRYPNTVAYRRSEIGDSQITGFAGCENKDNTNSFRHKGWGVDIGDPIAKEKGMRVIRPPKTPLYGVFERVFRISLHLEDL